MPMMLWLEIVRHQIAIILTVNFGIYLQVVPVSAATVVQQEPVNVIL